MRVELNKVISISYDLEIDTETGEKMLVEKVEQENPMVFLYGVSGLPEKFEENIGGLVQGDYFEFAISPDEGFGEFSEEAIVNLPIDVFMVDGQIDDEMLQIGNVIPMYDDQGNKLQGRVLQVAEDSVVMDFNHPLAGKNMNFRGQIVNIREASADELAHGHVHGPGGHHH